MTAASNGAFHCRGARLQGEVAMCPTLPRERLIYHLRLNQRPTWPRTDSKVIPGQRLGAAERASIFAGDFGSGFASATMSGACLAFSTSTFGPTLAISSSRLRIAC
jgi:hypothetical protein